MPDTPRPSRRATAEAAFAAAYPEVADMTTAQIREIRAYARAAVQCKAKSLRREQAMADWLAQNHPELPGLS